ncbi:DUF6361 family protein [Mesorhizobium sp. M0046]|uniref:DUF6361 family protein n=1 Tax=Mesorhizobium sp. M0046 TaxID=2956858 RepID=UPI0033394044
MNFLGWVDHDPRQEDAILRALGAAKGHDARDELGLGAIRDSFADLFFPGISTIQQRVRYFLFVQWCCEIAASQGEADRVLARLRESEETLIHSLEHLGEGHGVIGILSTSQAHAERNLLERSPCTGHASHARQPPTLGSAGRGQPQLRPNRQFGRGRRENIG